jgi:hypothetical protein
MPNKTPADFEARHGKFAKAAWYTHINSDTTTYLLIAEHYGLTSHANVFKGINLIHVEENSMHNDLNLVRQRWAAHLKNWIRMYAPAEDKPLLEGLV